MKWNPKLQSSDNFKCANNIAFSASSHSNTLNSSRHGKGMRYDTNLWNMCRMVSIGLMYLVFCLPAEAGERIAAYWDANEERTGQVYYARGEQNFPLFAGLLKEKSVIRNRSYLVTVQSKLDDQSDWTETSPVTLEHNDATGEEVTLCDGFTRKTVDSHSMPYGSWYYESDVLIPGAAHELGLWFCPNTVAINGLSTGQEVQMRLKIRYRAEISYVNETRWEDQATEYLNLTIRRAGNLSFEWTGRSGSEIVILVDGHSTYDETQGRINNHQKPRSIAQEEWVSAESVFESGTLNTQTDGENSPNSANRVNGFGWSGLEKISGENLAYGSWYLSSDLNRFLFRPKSAAINLLAPGESVKSTLNFNWPHSGTYCRNCVAQSSAGAQGAGTDIVDSDSVSVTIRVPEVRLSIGSTGTQLGESVRFTVTSNTNPNRLVPVKYSVSNVTGNFLNESAGLSGELRTSSLTFKQVNGTGPYVATLAVPVNARNGIIGDVSVGSVSVTLVDGANYLAVDSSAIAAAIVSEYEVPKLSLNVEDFQTSPFIGYVVRSDRTISQRLEFELEYKATSTSDWIKIGNLAIENGNEFRSTFQSVAYAVRLVPNVQNYAIETDQFGNGVSVLVQSTTVSETLPGLTISHTGSGSVLEGDRIEFKVQSTPQMLDSNLEITVHVRQEGGNDLIDDSKHVISSNNTHVVTRALPKDSGGFTFAIDTKFNAELGQGGEIVATIQPGDGYLLGSSMNSVVVSVLEVDRPVLSIAPVSGGETVFEGGNANFVVTALAAENPGTDFDVTYVPTEQGDFVDFSNYSNVLLDFSGSGGKFEAPLSFAIPENSSKSERGSITVTLHSDTVPVDYLLTRVESGKSATVAVLDNEIPELSIVGNGPVTEGVDEKVAFTVISSFMPDQNPIEDVRFRVTDPVNYLIAPVSSKTLRFVTDVNGDIAAQLEFELADNNIQSSEDSAASVSIELANKELIADYTVSSAIGAATASIQVFDDENLPSLSISANGSDSITELGTANFTITAAADSNPGNSFRFLFSISESGGFLTPASKQAHHMNFSGTGGTFTGSLAIATFENGSQGAAGSVTVTLEDDDSKPARYKVLSSGKSAIVKIFDKDVPELSIAGDNYVIEGQDDKASFTVTSNTDIASNLAVHYTATGGFFIAQYVSPAILEFNGTSTAKLEVDLVQDAVPESHGTVTVVLNADQDGTDYTVSAFESEQGTRADTASVLVFDDDSLPILTIRSVNPNILETPDAKAEFSVNARTTLNQANLTTVDVRYTVVETGSFLDSSVVTDKVIVQELDFAGTGRSISALLEIPIANDDEGEPSSSITVTLVESDRNDVRYLLGDRFSASVIVRDDEVPELSIIEGAAVEEGSPNDAPVTASFTITANFSPSKALTVRYTVAETGNFLPNGLVGTIQSQSFDFSSQKTSASLEIPIENDDLSEGNGSITVTLMDEELPDAYTNYSVAPDAALNSAIVQIVDDDSFPVLAIFGPSDGVPESLGEVRFTIRSNRSPDSALSVLFVPDEVAADYLTDSVAGGTQMANLNFVEESDSESDLSFVASVSIPLDNDADKERTGQVKVTLLEGNGYGLGNGANMPNVAYATIWDDDAPEIYIEGGDPVAEEVNTFASFNVKARVMPNQPLQVYYTPESSRFLPPVESGVATHTNSDLVFIDESGNGRGPYSAILNVAIDNDEIDEENGAITVVLNDDSPVNDSYTVADSPDNMASVIVRDDDGVPQLTVSGPEFVNESEELVRFVVTASADATLASSYLVRYTLTETGSFLQNPQEATVPNSTVELSFTEDNGAYTAHLEFALANDAVGEASGRLQLALRSSQPDTPPYLVASTGNQATVILVDDDVPEIFRIEGGENVLESETAMALYTVYSRIDPATSIVLRYKPESRNFLSADVSGTESATSPLFNFSDVSGNGNGPFFVTFGVPIADDEIKEDTGSLLVSLLPDVSSPPTYLLAEGINPASVAVFDDDGGSVPVVSIESANGTVNEGGSFNYTISSIPPPLVSLSVNLQVTQLGNFLALRVPNVIELPLSGSTTLTLHTIDSNTDNDGRVTMSVLPGYGYELGSASESSVTIVGSGSNDVEETLYSVVDNVIGSILSSVQTAEESKDITETQSPPVVSIGAENDSVSEGEPAEFLISLVPAPAEKIEVAVNLEQLGEFIGGELIEKVEIEPGRSTGMISVQTVDDFIPESDGLITATLSSGGNYEVTSDETRQSAEVAISDIADRLIHQQDLDKVYSQINEVNRLLLPNLASFLGSGPMDAVNRRMEQAHNVGNDLSFSLGGQNSIHESLKIIGENANHGSLTWKSALDDSAFMFEMFPEEGTSSLATVWGFGDLHGLHDSSGRSARQWLGEVYTGHLGVDTRLGEGLQTGLAGSITEAEVDYATMDGKSLYYDIRNTGIYPFIGYASPMDDFKLNATVGYGTGEIIVDSKVIDGNVQNSRFFNVALSGETRLMSLGGERFDSGELSAVGESWLIHQFVDRPLDSLRDMHIVAGQIHAVLEGDRRFELAGGASMSSDLSFGVRNMDISDLSSVGLELNGGFSYENPIGLNVNGSGFINVLEGRSIHELGLQGTVNFDHGNDLQGLQLKIQPFWGTTAAQSNTLLPSANSLENNQIAANQLDGTRVDSRIGYGMRVLDEVMLLTPYIGLNLAESGETEWQLGSTLESWENHPQGMQGSVEIQIDTNGTSRNLKLQGEMSW